MKKISINEREYFLYKIPMKEKLKLLALYRLSKPCYLEKLSTVIFKYASVKDKRNARVRITSDKIINKYVASWEELITLECEILKYNFLTR